MRKSLHWLQTDLYPLFRFCLSAFLLCVLILLPLVVCLTAIYFLFLGAHDINYYLSVKPTEWKWALVLCSLSILIWGSAVCSLLLRWIYALPLWLEGMRPFRATLAASWDATHRKFLFLLRTTGIYLAVTIAALLILEAFLFMMAGFALSYFNQAVQALFFTLSIYLLSAFILETAIRFIGISWGTCTLVTLYRDQQNPDSPQKSINPQKSCVKNPETRAPHRLLRPRIVLLILLFLLLSSVVVNAWLLNQTSQGKIPLVIAHRAGALHAPENSLAALEIAIRQGADYAEIDVQCSGDGVVVVVHDADLMKLAREPHVIRKTEYAILEQADIGRKFHPDFIGERLARLSDFLQKASGRIKLMIELKYYGKDPELAKEVLRLVHKAGMTENVLLMSLELSSVRQMQQLTADIPIGYLSAVDLGNLTSLNVDFLAVSTGNANSALLRKAGKKKIPVYVWTVNDVDTMLAMLEVGVDGVITDDPELAAEVIHRANELLPAERFMLRFRHLWNPFTNKSSTFVSTTAASPASTSGTEHPEPSPPPKLFGAIDAVLFT